MVNRIKQQPLKIVGRVVDNNDDGITRITRDKNTFLAGGTKEHHGQLAEVVRDFDEQLKLRGKNRETADPREVREVLERTIEKHGLP